MQVSNNYSAQSFGAISADNKVLRVFLKRKNKGYNISRYNALKELQKNNPVNIMLSTSSKSGRLYAQVAHPFEGFAETYVESMFYRFKNPLSFVEDMCARADEYRVKYRIDRK